MSFKLFFLSVALLVQPAFAVELSIPVDISSDKLELSPSEQHALFTGNVKIKHGEVRLGAEKISVYYAEEGGDIKEVKATNNVIIVHDLNTATGDVAAYNPKIGDVIMTGNVVMTRGESVLKGEKLRYDIKTGHMSLANEGGDGRVKATFSLKGKKSNE